MVLILAAGMAGIFLWKRSHTAGSPPTSENKGGSKDTKKKDAQSGTSDYTIELQGDSEVTVRLGDPYEDAGAVVKDRQGNRTDISVSLEEYDLNTAGEHQLVYKATDPKGKEISAQRTVTVTPNKEYGAKGLPICMYHYVYDANSVPENLNSNYIEVGTLEEELKYLHENDYYFPTWKEVREYLDGERILPDKSIVLSFDDGPLYIELEIPLFEKYQTPATSFVITSYYNDKSMLDPYRNNQYLTLESHTDNMHRGGGTYGHGGIFPALSKEEALADLKKSIEYCGNGDALAYPFGDYTAECEQTVEEAGFLCAVTTEPGKCYPGDDPYALTRVRMLGSQSLDQFISEIN